MKQMRVDPDGTLHCPKCNGSQFAFKRTGAGKVALGIAAPKRAHCLGCGENLKPNTGKPNTPSFAEIEQQVIARKAAKKAAKEHNSTE